MFQDLIARLMGWNTVAGVFASFERMAVRLDAVRERSRQAAMDKRLEAVRLNCSALSDEDEADAAQNAALRLRKLIGE